MKYRATSRVAAQVVPSTDARTLQGIVRSNAEEDAVIYTNEHGAYSGLGAEFDHEAANHSVGECLCGMAHTQGIESFWAMLKLTHKGTFQKLSPKHLQCYIDEFDGRNNVRDSDTIDIMSTFVAGAVGRRLRYRELIADNGLTSGARS